MEKAIKIKAGAEPEYQCPACHGTGFPPAKQPIQPGRKIYPAPCRKCGGKGKEKGKARAK